MYFPLSGNREPPLNPYREASNNRRLAVCRAPLLHKVVSAPQAAAACLMSLRRLSLPDG